MRECILIPSDTCEDLLIMCFFNDPPDDKGLLHGRSKVEKTWIEEGDESSYPRVLGDGKTMKNRCLARGARDLDKPRFLHLQRFFFLGTYENRHC